jgi:antitoxin component YwqK of YwqJK toxin-antitoxin module
MNLKNIVWGIVAIVIVLIGINRWILKEVGGSSEEKKIVVADVPATQRVNPRGEVTERILVARGEEFIERIFYVGDQEIGRIKEAKNQILEVKGKIPEGKVKFTDEYKKTYGEEYYRYGKRHGSVVTYYQDNQEVKSKEHYQLGVPISAKEYYADGKLRFEVDYADSREMGDNKEVGVGKLYYPNGNLKYEWNLTTREKEGFRKSYNQDGGLRAAFYYDEKGSLIRQEP